jgi:hypothetical protein
MKTSDPEILEVSIVRAIDVYYVKYSADIVKLETDMEH